MQNKWSTTEANEDNIKRNTDWINIQLEVYFECIAWDREIWDERKRRAMNYDTKQ